MPITVYVISIYSVIVKDIIKETRMSRKMWQNPEFAKMPAIYYPIGKTRTPRFYIIPVISPHTAAFDENGKK